MNKELALRNARRRSSVSQPTPILVSKEQVMTQEQWELMNQPPGGFLVISDRASSTEYKQHQRERNAWWSRAVERLCAGSA